MPPNVEYALGLPLLTQTGTGTLWYHSLTNFFDQNTKRSFNNKTESVELL